MPREFLGTAVWYVVIMVLTAGAPAGAAQPAPLHIELSGGEVVGSKDTFRFDQGEKVRIAWTSDETVELHLHGYDSTVTAGPGSGSALMRFTATATGRFPVTVHGGAKNDRTLIYIEIYPR